MLDSGAFFRRNRMLLWFSVAIFTAIFVSVQLGKAVSKADSHYGDIAECSYTHEAPALQTPVSPQHQAELPCLSGGTENKAQFKPTGI